MNETLGRLQSVFDGQDIKSIQVWDLVLLLEEELNIKSRIRELYSMGYDENTEFMIISSDDPVRYMHHPITDMYNNRIMVVKPEIDLSVVPEVL